MALPGWYSFSSVVEIHAALEGIAVAFFVALVVFDVLAHINKKREILFERIALFCFAIAILTEVCAYPYSRRIDTLSKEAGKVTDGRIAALNQEAGNARKEAGEANERATENAKESERLRKLAGAEALARLKIERELEWRAVSPMQRDILRAQRVPSPKVPLFVMSVMGDAEGAEYAFELDNALQTGWSTSLGISAVSGRPPQGLHIYVKDLENWRAKVLQGTLKGAGLDADIVSFGREDLQLMVGVKPRSKLP